MWATIALSVFLGVTAQAPPQAAQAPPQAAQAPPQAAQAPPQAAPTKCWAIALHGGAGTIDRTALPAVQAEYVASLERALREGAARLARGESSLDACQAVVVMLEDDPHFNAGRGAAFTEAGTHELDASIMDGSTLRCGAVAAVRTVRNPIGLARLVMERTPHILLMGDGAESFADAMGVARVENSYFSTEHRRVYLLEVLKERGKEIPPNVERPIMPATPNGGTVGCVALDTQGRLAAATSTGGLTGKRHGRVGDSPIIGAGTFAGGTCAVSCTGTGEEFIRHGIARSIAARMEFGGASLAQAADAAVFETLRPDDGGLIAVDAAGNIALRYSSEGMYRGAADCKGRFEVAIFEGADGSAQAAADKRAERGALLAIGGGLAADNHAVFARLGELAGGGTHAPRLVVATAASGDEPGEAEAITADIRLSLPAASVIVIGRTTPPADAAAAIDACTGMFFTGGDQKRIVDLYRTSGVEGPELAAMRRLLARGGVIAGTSAGDAMMGTTMFLTGRSAAALGIVQGPDDEGDTRLGPQIGVGMALEPWALTDSHFFERDRMGRLVAALESASMRLGLGICENACVEVDLATGAATVIGDGAVLLVDASQLRRDGLTRRDVRARLIKSGDKCQLSTAPPLSAATACPSGAPREVPPGTDRNSHRAAAIEFFTQAATANDAPIVLRLDGWQLVGWSDGLGGVCFDVGP